MAVITRAYSEVNGQIAQASSVNRVVDDLYTLQAGNINSANLANSAVGTGQLEGSAVTNAKLGDQAVDFDKTDYEALLAREVFN